MRKTLLILLALVALASWTVAQTTPTQNNTGDNVRVTAEPTVTTTDNSATIRWKTDDLAATNVKFGTDPNNLSQTQKHSGGSRDHNVTLSALQPGTTYYYAIMTNEGETRKTGQFTTKGTSSASTSTTSNTSTTSQTSTASNTATSGNDAIQITMGPEIRNFNGTQGTLYWETDKVAANDVRYGTDPNNMNLRAYEAGGSRQHSVELSNLQTGQTYYFEIMRRNGSIRQTGQFTLPATAQAQTSGTFAAIPVVMQGGTTATSTTQQAMGQTGGNVQITGGPTVQSVSDTQAIVTWTTNVASSSTVRYGQSWLALNQTAQSPWGTTHTVTISGLKPNTRYFFRAESAQAENTGQQARSSFVSFTTGAPGQAAQAPR
jgi:phosphodiesterase/alkaline phosphatase D-like protein